jgi:hypothetical protein
MLARSPSPVRHRQGLHRQRRHRFRSVCHRQGLGKQRRRWSDQPIWRSSPPTTSPSTRLPPFEHRVAAVSPLRAVALLPLVPAAGYKCAFSGMYVASGSHAAALTCALQPRRPIGPLRRCTLSSPSPREDIAGFHRTTSLSAGCRHPRMVFVAPPSSSSPTLSTAAASPQ